ncbi:hypothetical protein ACLB2K_041116 [Fragaria x ananassa]
MIIAFPNMYCCFIIIVFLCNRHEQLEFRITLSCLFWSPIAFKSAGEEVLLEITMAGVITKFFTASLFMWIAPVAILYGYNNNLIPVIAFYIYMAMKEPLDKHEPDPAFLAEAKASINQSTADTGRSSQFSKKNE